VVWEEGPYEWPCTRIDDRVFVEAVNGFALGLYPA
jgi:hypothetical protein